MPHINPPRLEVREFNATVHGAPDLPIEFTKMSVSPDVINVTYARAYGGSWMIRRIELAGPRVLKNRLSDTERKGRYWSLTRTKMGAPMNGPIDEEPDDRFFGREGLPDWALEWAEKNIPAD